MTSLNFSNAYNGNKMEYETEDGVNYIMDENDGIPFKQPNHHNNHGCYESGVNSFGNDFIASEKKMLRNRLLQQDANEMITSQHASMTYLKHHSNIVDTETKINNLVYDCGNDQRSLSALNRRLTLDLQNKQMQYNNMNHKYQPQLFPHYQRGNHYINHTQISNNHRREQLTKELRRFSQITLPSINNLSSLHITPPKGKKVLSKEGNRNETYLSLSKSKLEKYRNNKLMHNSSSKHFSQEILTRTDFNNVMNDTEEESTHLDNQQLNSSLKREMKEQNQELMKSKISLTEQTSMLAKLSLNDSGNIMNSNLMKDYLGLVMMHKKTAPYRYPANGGGLNDTKCIVCKKSKTSVSTIFFPCEHACVCDDCRFVKLIGSKSVGGWNHCPLCHEDIKFIRKRVDNYGKEKTIERLRNEYWSWVHEIKPYVNPVFLKQFKRKSKANIKRALSVAAMHHDRPDERKREILEQVDYHERYKLCNLM